MPLAPTPEVLQREQRVVQLEAEGKSFREIAEAIGISNKGDAYRLWQRALRRGLTPEAIANERTRQLAELDQLVAEAWEMSRRQHFVVSQAGTIVNGPDGQPLDDDGPRVQALRLVLSVLERRARLLGLDAPTRARVEVVTEDAVDAAIAAFDRQLSTIDAQSSEA